MKIICEQNKMLQSMLGAQVFNGNLSYRFITYLTEAKHNNEYLLFNTLTRQMLALTQEEYSNIISGHRDALYEQLVNLYFLVPETHDDKKLYNQILNLHKTFDTKKGLTHFVILPTTDCNARCFYCFEHGAKRYPMTDKTAEDVVDFIIKKSFGQKVKLHWFGGEPLYNVRAIDIICDRLTSSGVNFSSTMVSNGYLFDSEIINKAKERWNLKGVQITLDGTENVYNRIKAYIYKDGTSAFERVLKNIETLLNAKTTVSIRLNMDKNNKTDLYNLVDLLSERFANHKNKLYIYASLIYENSRAKDDILKIELPNELILDSIELSEYIFKKGFTANDVPKKQIPINACLADGAHSVIILPDGSLGRCDHYSDNELIGNIYSDQLDENISNSWKELKEPVELCKTCPLVPQCIRLKKCPHGGKYNCDSYEQKRKLHQLYQQMRNAYNKFTT